METRWPGSKIGVISFGVILALQPSFVSAKEFKNQGARGLVYRVKTATNTVYLAGSIHLLRKSDYPLPVVYEEAYKASEKIVFEILSTDKNMPGAKQKILRDGMYGGGDTIKNHIPAKTYGLLRQQLKKTGMPAGGMDSFRPWMVAVTLAVLEYQKLGASEEDGLDNYYEKKAVIDGKVTDSLETVDFQIGLFSGLSEAEEGEMLDQTLAELAKIGKSAKEILDSWKSGNEKRLEEIIFEEKEKYEDIMDRLLFERNRNWLTPIKGFIESGKPTMVVAGAAHLIGENGLVDLLEKEGYKIERLEPALVGAP